MVHSKKIILVVGFIVALTVAVLVYCKRETFGGSATKPQQPAPATETKVDTTTFKTHAPEPVTGIRQNSDFTRHDDAVRDLTLANRRYGPPNHLKIDGSSPLWAN